MALPFLVLNRCFSSSTVMAAAIKNITIVGGGLMGSGIAQVGIYQIYNILNIMPKPGDRSNFNTHKTC